MSRTKVATGCDYHPGFQEIAFVNTEIGTVECSVSSSNDEQDRRCNQNISRNPLGTVMAPHARYRQQLSSGIAGPRPY